MTSHRLKGIASEMLFAAKYYELVDDEQMQLIKPTIDYGWDWKIEKTGIRIQVKRHTPNKKYNPFNMDLRRKRNKCTGNYTGAEFDYIAIHDVDADDFIIADVSQLMNGNKMKQSVGIRSLRNLGMCHLVKLSQGQ